MGWSSGSALCNRIIDIIYTEIPEEKRKNILAQIFEDCDTLNECIYDAQGKSLPVLEAALKEAYCRFKRRIE